MPQVFQEYIYACEWCWTDGGRKAGVGRENEAKVERVKFSKGGCREADKVEAEGREREQDNGGGCIERSGENEPKIEMVKFWKCG